MDAPWSTTAGTRWVHSKAAMRPLLLGFLVLSVSVFAQAQGTQFWNQSSFESFEKGTPHGVAIRSDGRLETSPEPAQVLATSASYIWSVAADGRGTAYLGTGSPAMVLKVAPDGSLSKLLETKDVAVQVVRLGPDGMLYAATSPNGKVYRIDPNGPDIKLDNAPRPVYKQDHAAARLEPAVVFDPANVDTKPTYIWDLAFDAQGRMYVATGGPAAIYRVDLGRVDLKRPAAQPEKFFSSDEQHIRSLIFSKDGTLYAGSDGRGLVYRIAPDGKGFVLFEAPKQEIPALALDPEGNLYVAALGEKGRSSLPPLSVHSAPTLTATIRIVTATPAESSNDSSLIPGGTVIYQIAPDGAPRQLWDSPHDVVYALAWQAGAGNQRGGLLVGSGNQGHLYRIDADGTYADLAHLEAMQATAFALVDRKLFVGTSNIGKLYRLSSGGKEDRSTYISTVHDANFFSEWGRAQVRGSGGYELFARTGNIEQPTEGWSDWRKVTPGASAETLQKGRFLQWKAVLRPDARLNAVGFYYLPQNVAPVVDEIVMQLHARVPAAMNPAEQSTPVAINLPKAASDGISYVSEPSSTPLMGLPERNWATLRWKAHDDNGDQLSYSIYYRGDDESNWLLLQKNIRDSYASFDVTRIPDGGYTLRVVASDAPSHPIGASLTGYKDSEHVLLDTTPPVLSPLEATLTGSAIHVVFDAQARLATIARAYYSVDGGAWQYMEPVNRLSDSLHEHYDFAARVREGDADSQPGVGSMAAQQHVIAVRVVDRAGNMATAKAVVQ